MQSSEQTEPGGSAPGSAENTEPSGTAPSPAENTEPSETAPSPAKNTEPSETAPTPAKNTEPSETAPTPAKSSARNRSLLVIGVLALLIVAIGVVFLIAPAEEAVTPVAQPSASASAAAPTPSGPASADPAAPIGDLNAVKVTGSDKPAVEVKVPFGIAKTTVRVLTAGKGDKVATGQRLTIDYVGLNGQDGKTFDTSFGKTDPVSFVLGDENLIKGMNEGLTGVNVGSRVLLAIPAADGYGAQGAPDAGIGPNDTLLFVIDVKSATTPLTRASGTAVAPKAGLPTVALDPTGQPTITVPKATAPSDLVVQPLITGKGAKVTTGQSITVHYTGVIWASGKQFDSSWANGSPATFAIGTGNVIPGWDKGLVGQTIGSQMLLVIPPTDGYGAAGSPDAGITGTDTLVFVVDILAAG